jgi:hypothetical protein
MKDFLEFLAEAGDLSAGEPEAPRAGLPFAPSEMGVERAPGSAGGGRRRRHSCIAHHEVLPAREPRFASPGKPLPPPLASALRDLDLVALPAPGPRPDALAAARERRPRHADRQRQTLVYHLPIFERFLLEPDTRPSASSP